MSLVSHTFLQSTTALVALLIKGKLGWETTVKHYCREKKHLRRGKNKWLANNTDNGVCLWCRERTSDYTASDHDFDVQRDSIKQVEET